MGNTKILLKHVACRYFPHRFVFRNKFGFPLPLKSFFSSIAFRELMEEEFLPGMEERNVVNARVVRQWWNNLPNLNDACVEALWICISFELWAQQFLDVSRLARSPSPACSGASQTNGS